MNALSKGQNKDKWKQEEKKLNKLVKGQLSGAAYYFLTPSTNVGCSFGGAGGYEIIKGPSLLLRYQCSDKSLFVQVN